MKKLQTLFSIFFFLFVSSYFHQAHAMEFIHGDSVSIPKDRVIDSSVFIAGNSVKVEGEITGDVFCAGKDITISGPVHGDVICAGQTVTVNNVTDGNVRVAGQMVTINGAVGVNATAFAQTLTIGEAGAIAGELITAADTLTMNGWVGKDLQGWTSSTTIDGQVDRNVIVDTDSFTVGDTAMISGVVQYVSSQNGSIAKSASISGSIVRTTPAPEQKAAPVKNPPIQTVRSIGSGMFLFTTILVGIILAFLFPTGLFTVVGVMRENWLMTAIRGLAVLIFVPLLIIVLAITIIGIPAALLLGMGFVAAYFIGRVFCTFVVGQIILESLYKDKSTAIGWVLGTGVFVLWAAFTLPIIGGIASLFVTIFGFGGITYLFIKKSSKK